jgi:hypothetical protein
LIENRPVETGMETVDTLYREGKRQFLWRHGDRLYRERDNWGNIG